MSQTLAMICEHWLKDLNPEGGYEECPFHVENFCREMDELLASFGWQPIETFRYVPKRLCLFVKRSSYQSKGKTFFGINIIKGFTLDEFSKNHEIILWMPIPEVPKSINDEGSAAK